MPSRFRMTQFKPMQDELLALRTLVPILAKAAHKASSHNQWLRWDECDQEPCKSARVTLVTRKQEQP